jgi:hypothetical protein
MSRSRGFLLPPVDSLVNPHPTTCFRRTELYNQWWGPFVSPPRRIDPYIHPPQRLPLENTTKWWQFEGVVMSLVPEPSLAGWSQRLWGYPVCRLTDGIWLWFFNGDTWTVKVPTSYEMVVNGWWWLDKDLEAAVLAYLKVLDWRAEKR